MSAMQKVHTLVTTGAAARTEKLMSLMQDIDKAIGKSHGTVQSIKDRGFTTNLFSSSREDLLQVAESQNTINGLMMEMIQEVVVVNTMGYAFLAGVIGEFMRSVDEGWTDSNGKFHVLSKTGKEFAHTASEIFTSIMNGSRATQEKIESSALAIADHQHRFTELDEILSAQSEALNSMRDKQVHAENQAQEFASAAITALREQKDRISHLESTREAGFAEVAGLRQELRMNVIAQQASLRKTMYATGALSVIVVLLGIRAMGIF